MLKDLLICFLASSNILIFSFIGLNHEAFAKMRNYRERTFTDHISTETLVAQFQDQIISQEITMVENHELMNIAARFLVIPKLNVISPVTSDLTQGVMTLKSFIPPGKTGQTVILGHSSDYPWRNNPYATVFTLLPEMKPGDEIQIVEGQNNFRYQVKRTVITDEKLSGLITEAASGNELILSTCYPIGFFGKRFNVVAVPTRNI